MPYLESEKMVKSGVLLQGARCLDIESPQCVGIRGIQLFAESGA
jgi:hypothetical protein